ncbi:hypothetical protein GCM10010222_39840 [Streptomyces tanashiensis]|uniref:hypothetical protein n=1 Tax=Streptomyces tanashiensis TaxID=67367 RepID=UPI0019B50C03|nr:hypothetical protein [Streptomyces tanashiensis]GGS94229.1 hypothetical protein GCM10010222_39840 [Streptomyces tanashiensis]
MGYGPTSKMLVNLVDGCAQAKNVAPGSAMWTLDGDRTVQTTVVDVTAVKGRQAVDVVTDHMTFTVGPDHEEDFASRYATALTACTGLPARLEAVSRPSGFLKRDLPGFRVRVVSSYLSDAMRHYAGGDAHHMRQHFPRVVLRDIDTFQGFLDGYIDGDGCNVKHGWGRMIVSANVPFLVELATIIGARFTPSKRGLASRLYVSNRWADRNTFVPEHHRISPPEATWIRVHEVRPRPALGAKPFTFYSYRLAPYPTFLVNGHLVREPW